MSWLFRDACSHAQRPVRHTLHPLRRCSIVSTLTVAVHDCFVTTPWACAKADFGLAAAIACRALGIRWPQCRQLVFTERLDDGKVSAHGPAMSWLCTVRPGICLHEEGPQCGGSDGNPTHFARVRRRRASIGVKDKDEHHAFH